MKNIALFCSNPINGGTAEVFTQIVSSLEKKALKAKIIPCVNANNPVEVYKTVSSLKRINIISGEEIFDKTLYGGKLGTRICNKIKKSIKYHKIKSNNISEIMRFLDDYDIDCAMVHNGGYVGDDLCNQFIKAAYFKKIPVRVVVFHNDFNKNKLQKLKFYFYDKTISQEATGIVTVSNYTKNRMKDQSFLKKQIDVIYNGLEMKHTLCVEEMTAKVKIILDKINILMIGNFMDNKGQLHLLHAIKIIKKRSQLDHIHVSIIGNVYDVSYYNHCIEYIDKNHLNNDVSIYHNINNAGEYTQLFDIVTVTSTSDESFGLVALEAMEHYVPAVVFGCGGIPEVVEDGVTGIVVPVGDDEGLADSLINLSNNKELRNKMGQAAHKRYEDYFSIEHMSNNYMKYLGLED